MTRQPFRFTFFLLICLSIPLTATAQTVNITDPNLRAAIEAELGKASGDTITADDMATLTQLEAEDVDIRVLTGLERATNLTELYLYNNSISDISPLAGLTNLTRLILLNNSISNISPLRGLTNLTELYLYNNSISDISPLRGLTNLTELYLYNNSISDISPLRGLTNLTELYLYNNSISDISPLAGLTNLTWLDLDNNSISDISPLRGLTNLTWLYLDNNSISDISPLAGLTNLTWLILLNNSISDISPLVANTGLGNDDTVYVNGNPLSDASINTHIPALVSRGVTVEFGAIVVQPEDMAQMGDIPDPYLRAAIEAELGKASGDTISADDMATLTQLEAEDVDIRVLTGLERATNLTELYLDNNSISDISPLAGLTNLTRLILLNTFISDLSPLAGLTNLTTLQLVGGSISDLSPLAGLTQLTRLDLVDHSISDLSPLAGLTNLTFLSLVYSPISDISPLAGLTQLTLLNLEDNNISDISPLAGLTNLEILALENNSISDISPLVANTGLGNDDTVYVNGNPLSDASINTHIPALVSRGVNVEFGAIVVQPEDMAQMGDIPDPNLRAAIEAELGKASGDTITADDMATLTQLEAEDVDIRVLTGLERATNLTELDLDNNSISDISPLAGLTNLEILWLYNNSISDISPLTGLTNLTWLDLDNNSISDISPLAGLTNLEILWLENNSISDISPLVANTGLGNGDVVGVSGNPLDSASINTHIPALQSRGVTVQFDDIVAQPADVNGDGTVNILDLVFVASRLGNQGQNLPADVNGDGVVNILDLVLVAGMFGAAASAPSAHPQAHETLTAVEVRQWLTDAKALEVTDPIIIRGIVVLQQLLVSLTPTETKLLPNYPNPFNPETWIPYRLAEDAFVTLTIYDQTGHAVRTLDVGHQTAAIYENRSRAIYWDGRNQVGETVASGVYFYHLSAGDYSATRKMLILK